MFMHPLRLTPSIPRPLVPRSVTPDLLPLSKKWVVYSKAPMAGPEQVLRYLGRYTHRIAISNQRLVALENGKVTFRYRDRQRGNVQRVMPLEAPRFVQRFLVHVLPSGFVRIRHFGLQANGQRSELLARAREALDAPTLPDPQPCRESYRDLFLRLTGRDPLQCPFCKSGVLVLMAASIPPAEQPRPP